MSRELIPTGIPAIDEFITGLPQNSLILIIGDPGSGFITFMHQLLVQRSKYGIPAIYSSLDKSESEIYSDLKSFEWELSHLNWHFNDLSPSAKHRQSKTLKWEGDAVNIVSHNFFKKIAEFKGDNAISSFDSVVSTITNMLIQSKLTSVLRFMNDYSTVIHGTNGWHFLTMVRGVHGKDKENVFSHYSDVVLEFAMRLNTETQLYERVLGVRKLLGINSRVFPIEYDKNGIRPITTSKIR
ncbi:MAG: RAD55 family ATPase [Candidatus Hodarchaeales archaeon]|jgi:KaiC/GvpD/RAD55 family RecA-like ATPase